MSVLYGFEALENVYAERVTTVGVEVVWDAIRESTRIHNENLSALMSPLVETVTWATRRYMLPSGGTLQPLDDKGNPLPRRETGYYDIALPIKGGGDAWGDNRVSRALMTVEEVARHTEATLRRDIDWVRRHLLAAWYTNTAYNFADPQLGTLVVRPLAITSDGVTYLRNTGEMSTDEHFLAQADAISDAANPFDTIVEELREHPSNNVSNGSPVIVLVPTNLRASIKALADFVPADVGLVVPGVATDRASNVDVGTLGTAMGTIAGLPIVLRQWDMLPSNYLLAYASGAGRIFGMRQYDAPALQGLILEQFSPDGNWQEAKTIRYAGFGVINRVGALVYRIGNASYGIPSGYAAPLSV